MSNLPDIRRIFNEVSDLPPAERAPALDRLCANSPELRAQIDSLLNSHDSDAFLSNPTVSAPTQISPGTQGPGAIIGPYKLLQMIGEGGFGIVYMAEQQQPVRRKVALKIIKLGMDTRQVIARFEAERQALAMMEHPNIAKVLDAGATELGRPYFVMELVRGIPITEYCDTNKLSTADRLALFMQVCNAVQHAHQKGVIHRDIKPSNVLVTLHDGKPVPKVIDFGIAKATNQRLTDKTLFTEFRQFIGTPEYMSPEQAEMSGLDVDTRSDIYSLGVLLYELLTGTTPFDALQMRGQAIDRIQRLIRETEPPRPSTRVETLAYAPSTATTTSLADVARHRRTDAAGLGRLLRGDLDWIVMRAIEKDRTRRYETATALADDVQRHLNDEPVEAGPPSTLYRLRKFAKRNRLMLLPSAIGAAALLIAFVGIIFGLIEARAGRRDAVDAQRQAEEARGQTAVALQQAQSEADRNRAIGQYLQDAVAASSAARDTHATRADLIPLSEITGRGRDLFRGDHAIIASALMAWASQRQLAGDPQSAEPALQEAAAMLVRMHGDADARASHARLMLAKAIAAQPGREPEAEAAFRAVIEATRQNPGPDSGEHAIALEALVAHLLATGPTGREDEIAALWGQTVRADDAAFGPLDRRTIREMAQYGQWLQIKSRTDEAVPVLEEAIRRGEQALPQGDLTIYLAINSMILLEFAQNGDWAKAAGWYDRLLQMSGILGGEYAHSAVAMRLQAAGFHAQAGNTALAIERLEQFLLDRTAPGYESDWSSASRIEMSIAWLEDVLDANPDLGRRVQLARADGADRVMAGMSAPPATILFNAGQWLADHAFDTDAADILARAVSTQRTQPQSDPVALRRALTALGQTRLRLRDHAAAQPPLREALALAESQQAPEAELTLLRDALATSEQPEPPPR